MTARSTDPRRLDVVAAAAAGASFDGQAPLAQFARLHEPGVSQGDASVTWQARFEQRRARGGAPEPALRLQARARVARQCQRCLEPVLLELQIDRAFRFAPDEASAAALDADNDDEDMLAASRAFDLIALVEDELLLAQPLVPRHDSCPQPLATAGGAGAPASELPAPDPAQHPFAALAALKREPRH